MSENDLIELNQNIKRVKYDIIRLNWYAYINRVNWMKYSMNGIIYNQ